MDGDSTGICHDAAGITCNRAVLQSFRADIGTFFFRNYFIERLAAIIWPFRAFPVHSKFALGYGAGFAYCWPNMLVFSHSSYTIRQELCA